MKTIYAAAILLLASCGSQPEMQGSPREGNDLTNRIGEVLPAPAEARRGPVSAYTKLDDCTVLAQNREEGGFLQRRCKGHAGYDLIVTEADLRANIDIVTPQGETRDLAFSQVVSEGRFNDLGSTIEWRGPQGAGPEAMIVRMNVARPEMPAAADTSYLVVVRLAEPTCIVARVDPGPSQNEEARKIADTAKMPPCLGVDAG